MKYIFVIYPANTKVALHTIVVDQGQYNQGFLTKLAMDYPMCDIDAFIGEVFYTTRDDKSLVVTRTVRKQ